MRYFTGILFQVSGIIILVTLGMTIVGVGFQRSILIGLIAGIMNVIPYLGPLIGSTIGVLLGIITHLHMDFYSQLLPLIMFMILVFIIVQLVDNLIFQPFIYSSSVHAHPLEIFLVIMIAANVAGIAGMILAIPTYTVLRVFAKEFFHKFEFVKKLTQNIE
jgi:predicted PurR-regulated permease PerM